MVDLFATKPQDNNYVDKEVEAHDDDHGPPIGIAHIHVLYPVCEKEQMHTAQTDADFVKQINVVLEAPLERHVMPLVHQNSQVNVHYALHLLGRYLPHTKGNDAEQQSSCAEDRIEKHRSLTRGLYSVIEPTPLFVEALFVDGLLALLEDVVEHSWNDDQAQHY